MPPEPAGRRAARGQESRTDAGKVVGARTSRADQPDLDGSCASTRSRVPSDARSAFRGSGPSADPAPSRSSSAPGCWGACWRSLSRLPTSVTTSSTRTSGHRQHVRADPDRVHGRHGHCMDGKPGPVLSWGPGVDLLGLLVVRDAGGLQAGPRDRPGGCDRRRRPPRGTPDGSVEGRGRLRPHRVRLDAVQDHVRRAHVLRRARPAHDRPDRRRPGGRHLAAGCQVGRPRSGALLHGARDL